jgi:formylglycine-generating enzyme required for sulfatase activity
VSKIVTWGLVLLVTCVCLHVGYGAVEPKNAVRNGPLNDRELGHKAQHEGNRESLRLAVQYLIDTYGDRYPRGAEFLKRLDAEVMGDATSGPFLALKREALLLENPAIDFDRMLLVQAKRNGKRYSANWQTRVSCDSRSRLDKKLGTRVPSYEDALLLAPIKGDGVEQIVYGPATGTFVGDVDLHFDGNKLLFTSFRDMSTLTREYRGRGDHGKGYGVFELTLDPKTGESGGEPRVVSPDMGTDADCYDACYLPDGRIIFASTATYEGVPCVGGGDYVAALFRMEPDGGGVRRLTFDQDGNWHPSVLENGRVMYLRWEYTDQAHYFNRVLMTMNPDGTDQKAWYGSNSYWPNSMFFARQIPGKTSMFIASITGHHSNAKGGALCLFDVSRGRHEADGAVQFLTGRGKPVQPLVIDGLHRAYSPMFYNPYPIDDTFFLATTSQGSVYLLDTFDNMLCLKEAQGGERYYEPIPFRRTPTPRTMPDRVNTDRTDATVLISDVHAGPGLRGVPRGTAKALRVYRYEYGPRHKGGHYAMGMEAGWDAKQILGTVPVEDDGSVSFKVPANTPFAIQPLDDEGRALQLMRRWTVAMPGEVLSCVGCHESADMPPPVKPAAAMQRAPSDLTPFYGPTRGFSFTREIQPVLDRYCVGCHDGQAPDGRYEAADRIVGTGGQTGKRFAEAGIPNLSEPRGSHRALHPFVRRNGPEGDNHLLTPLEFHVRTSELFQMLDKGHHDVKLGPESRDKLVAWADLNAPFHGTWTEAGADRGVLARRQELRQKYGGPAYDPEVIANPYVKTTESTMPAPLERNIVEPAAPRVEPRPENPPDLDLGDGISMALVSLPAGEFSMGSHHETPIEQPLSRVTIEKPFVMGQTEVTLGQYRQFDPDYLNGVYDMHYKDQVHRGYYMNDVDFPVIRVSWERATAFCEWLSKKTGQRVSLPTEAQWEWACRAGTTTPLSFGDLHANFSEHANLADITVKKMAVRGVNPQPIANPNRTDDYELKDPRSDDGVLHLAPVGRYQSNPWGLYDMHGNVAEWTRSDYTAYPYRASDGRNDGGPAEKVVRGGSWHDRMYRASSSYRLGFPTWQRVYHVGFRIVVEDML